jgi:hypothetical protein
MRSIPNETEVMLYLYFEKIGDERPTLNAASYVPLWVNPADRQVLPLSEVLTELNDGGDGGVRAQDAARVRAAHRELAELILGSDIPPEELAREYFVGECR